MADIGGEHELAGISGVTPARPGVRQRNASIVRAQARTVRLSFVLVVASLLSLPTLLAPAGGAPTPYVLSWWAIAAAFAAAELAVFHLEINHEAHSFTLSEVPIAIGLFFALPGDLIIGRIVGAAVILVVRERQSLPKVIFNLSMFLSECCLALAVFRLLPHHEGLADARNWLGVLAAVLAADALSIVCVSLAIRWHGAEPEPRRLLAIGVATATVNTTIAITGSLLLAANAAAAALLVVLVTIVFFAYRSFARLSQRYASLRLLYDFTTVVSGSLRVESVLYQMIGEARKLLRAERAEIVLHHPGGDRTGIRVSARGDEPPSSAPVLADDGRPGWLRAKVVEDRRAVVVERSTKDPSLRAYLEALGVKDLILAPLTAEGEVVGTILVADRLGDVSSFDAEDARLFETLANHASIALENGRLLDRLSSEVHEREHQALHDALTGLPNRVKFFRDLRALIDARQDGNAAFTVMLMDLDRFKEVNDTLGHHAGDFVLQEVARRLGAALPADGLVTRLGGDEFALLLPGVAGRQEAEAVAGRILTYLRQPCFVDGMTLDVGASVGIALWPEHDDDASGLLKRADVAMYAAKNSSSRISVYDAEADTSSPRRLAVVAELREAVEGGLLEVHYQPKIALPSRKAVGVEALVRWRHPERGFVPPDEFIPLAEQSGLIGPLTLFVLETALRQCRRWRDEGLHLPVAVNVAVRSLLDSHLPSAIADLLSRTGLPADVLTVEITETGIMTDPQRTIGTLETLAEMGVLLSIDDFGTGYSSLSYLQHLPVHEVKIDRSFVKAMGPSKGDATIVQSVIDLGRNLNLLVVAEGVEDELTLERLSRMGCGSAQGYHISRPVPAALVTEWAADHAVQARPLRLVSGGARPGS